MEYQSLTKDQFNEKTRNFFSKKELHFFIECVRSNYSSRMVLLFL